MLFLRQLGTAVLASSTAAYALTIPPTKVLEEREPYLVERQDTACTNGPTTRSCWQSGFSIATDFDAKAPPNGVTRRYTLEITNTTKSPDGTEKRMMVINDQYPGPVIRGSWGDTFEVTVINNLQDNGTSIHWHGVRQLNSCQNDGANGVTECPIPPNGGTFIYRFRATQFGTSWYHSHHSAQYGEGIVGTLIIDGPASANYDVDLGTLPITDLFYESAFSLNYKAQRSTTGPPTPDNILVNGTHVNANGGGSYFKIKVTKGKKYRLRLINTAVDQFFHVSADSHPFKVITSDFVPVKPWTTSDLNMAIGQRYDVIINANQAVGNYWLRTQPGTSCGGNRIINSGKVLGAIIQYDGAPDSEPTTTGVELGTSCDDALNFSPYVANIVPNAPFESTLKKITVDFAQTAATNNLVTWPINGSSMDVSWDKPTLEYVKNGETNYPTSLNVVEMPNNQWYYWVLQVLTPVPVPHPIHLHGHDFYILGKGSGTFDGTTTGLNFNNPIRRDVTTLPVGGWLVLAFPADNPGAWLMHCHIAWHVSQGLSLQFLERQSEILGAIGSLDQFDSNCAAWESYWNGPHAYQKDDSGI